jgi:hypothetical protein
MTTKKHRKSAFVPRLLVRTALMSVIPACALGCGSGDTTSPPPTDAAKTDTGPFGVAAVAYPAYETGIPDGKGDTPADTTVTPDAGKDVFGVAAVAYPAYEAGAG